MSNDKNKNENDESNIDDQSLPASRQLKMNFYHENYDFLDEKQVSCNSPEMGLGAKKTPSVWSQHIPTFHTLF